MRNPTPPQISVEFERFIKTVKLMLIEVADLIGFAYLLYSIVRGEIHW